MGYIAGIGGANMDIHGKSDRQLIMRDSNPGSLIPRWAAFAAISAKIWPDWAKRFA